ncbi:MAG: GNAT family protein [Candidatus Thermoplasmatota archaeon]|nr:GNAT family protein [Candidatus Thermoplasmatota archaeon]
MIKGKKVILRALECKDLKRCWKWINDPEVTKGMGSAIPKSMYEEEKWYEETLKNSRTKIFAIQVGKKHIGNISLEKIDYRNRKAALGIMIGEPNYWDKGYGTDAIKTLLSVAFNELNLHKVYLYSLTSNKRAIRCYKKCGFEVEGLLRDDIFKAGKYQDLLVMSAIKRAKK